MTTTPTAAEIRTASEEQNKAAIADYAKKSQVKTVFKDGVLYGAFADGTVIGAKFVLSVDDFEELTNLDDEPLTQFRKVLELTGGKDVAAQLMKRNVAEAMQFARKWFATFEELQGVTLGE